MQRQPDHRMPPWRWWLVALAMTLTVGAFCLVTRSWTPLRDGWPIIGLIVALAVMRQGADIYEHQHKLYREHRAGRRHTPHA